MHSITLDKGKKALIAALSGNIGVDQANAMLGDFKKSVSEINPKDHVLIINPENISASLFVLPILQSFVHLVGQLNFKKIYLVNSDKYAGIIKQGLSGYSVANNIAYVDSVKDALK